ncbi:uncharacterized protein LOC126319949 [Schistocerca gregaria]|uniref:uncharacterized protein LOC126319949 n=1 Tax=Schistocerca gregaria TaxID=7010 RepID=UPI00211E642B|nr:uncharacterized protein LOC126319949 [Schistocerca gregaria]
MPSCLIKRVRYPFPRQLRSIDAHGFSLPLIDSYLARECLGSFACFRRPEWVRPSTRYFRPFSPTRAYSRLKKESKPSVDQKLRCWSQSGLLKAACQLPEVTSASWAQDPSAAEGAAATGQRDFEIEKRIYLELCSQLQNQYKKKSGKVQAGKGLARVEKGNRAREKDRVDHGGSARRCEQKSGSGSSDEGNSSNLSESTREGNWLDRYCQEDWDSFRKGFREKVDLFERERSAKGSFDWCSPLEESEIDFWRQPFPWDTKVIELSSLLVGNGNAEKSQLEFEDCLGGAPKVNKSNDLSGHLKKVEFSFHQYQREAINATMAHHHLLLALPTGGGKTLCYVVPACLELGLTVVVSPLISLMNDQSRRLAERGIRSAIISSQLTSHELAVLYRTIGEGASELKILFATAERVGKSRRFIEVLSEVHKKGLLRRFVIDEAHCISEWGHDFRQDYRRLSTLRRRFPSVPVVAVTGTCTPVVRKDILEQLLLVDHGQTCHVIQDSFNRANLWIQVCRKSKQTPMLDILKYIVNHGYERACGIIYSMTVAQTERLSAFLSRHGINAIHYHGGMSMSERAIAQKSWETSEVSVICTTVAFGLGIDKSNVRYVLHSEIPTSLECYYQQIGRAGRDGELSDCILFYSPLDRVKIEKITGIDYATRKRKPVNALDQKRRDDNLESVGLDRERRDNNFSRNLQNLHEPNQTEDGRFFDPSPRDDEPISYFDDAYDPCPSTAESVDESVRTMKQEKLDDLTQYCRNTRVCRRVQLMSYFGQAFEASECRGQCDVCAPKKKRVISKFTPAGCANLERLIEDRAVRERSTATLVLSPAIERLQKNTSQFLESMRDASEMTESGSPKNKSPMYFIADLRQNDSTSLPSTMVELHRSINKVLRDKVTLRLNKAEDKRRKQLQAQREKKLKRSQERKAELEVCDQEGVVRTKIRRG